MKISYVIPTFNRSKLIPRTIESLKKQPYKNIEVFIIDDGSTDNLNAQIDQWISGDDRFKYYRFEGNKGQNFSRNFGIEKSTGEIVTILDSDDQDMGVDLNSIISIIKEKDLTGLFTPVQSLSKGSLLAKTDSENKIFNVKGFIDGHYSGEYQAFLQKKYLPAKFFEENLGIRRTCTLLSWLKFDSNSRFYIHNTPTRLYDDTGDDRMGNACNIVRDAHEISICNSHILKRHAAFIEQTNNGLFSELVLKKAFYDKLSSKLKIKEVFQNDLNLSSRLKIFGFYMVPKNVLKNFYLNSKK